MRLGLAAAAAVVLLAACPSQPDETLPCGYGTVERDGECVADNCGPGSIDVDGECWARDLQFVSFPLEAGATVRFGQTFHGGFSHTDSSRYAVDIGAAEGTLVVAARDGIVSGIKEDSSTGCPDISCADQGNYVDIDHGDGTSALYVHLQQDGALVDVGDVVCAGQPIGRSGNTGWSSGPHLHFAVEDAFALSLPLRFEELLEVSDGIPAAGMEVESDNADPGSCSAQIDYSDCGENLFGHMGIQLDPGVPCSVAELDTPYSISGRASVGATVGIGTFGSIAGQDDVWSYQCFNTDADGAFAWDLVFASDQLEGTTYLELYAGDNDCYSFQGWAYSVAVTLLD